MRLSEKIFGSLLFKIVGDSECISTVISRYLPFVFDDGLDKNVQTHRRAGYTVYPQYSLILKADQLLFCGPPSSISIFFFKRTDLQPPLQQQFRNLSLVLAPTTYIPLFVYPSIPNIIVSTQISLRAYKYYVHGSAYII